MNKKRFLPYLFIFLLVPLPIKAQEPCIEPFPELNRETLLERFSSLIEGGATPQQAFENVAGFIIQRAKIGEKLTLDQGQSCYEVAGVNISLNYSINGEKAPTLIRQEGVVKGFYTYEKISFYYDRHGVKGGKEFQEIYDMAVSVALKPSSPDNIVLSSDRTILCPEETVTIKAELRCGKCSMKMKEISFQWKGPGELTPINTSTGRDGIAETVFKAKYWGETVVTAYYYDKLFGVIKGDIGLKTECIYYWDIEIIVDYSSSGEGVVEIWGVKVKFDNIPLYKWIPGLPPIFLYYQSEGYLTYGKFSYYDGEIYQPGTLRGIPVWGLNVLPNPEEIEEIEEWKLKTIVLNFWIHRNSAPITYEGAIGDLQFNESLEIPLEKLSEGKPFSMEITKKDSVGKSRASLKFTPSKKST